MNTKRTFVEKHECRYCKTTEGYLTVGKTSYRKDGSKRIKYICRPCNALKKRIELKRNGTAQHRAEKNSRSRYPERVKARLLAKKIPLKPCEICGDKAQRHHPDYSKPLEVRFLCQTHHSEIHRGVLCLK